MVFEFNRFSLRVDFERGVLTSLVIDGIERVVEPSPLFRVGLRDRDGNRTVISSLEASECTLTENGAIYTGFPVALSVLVSLCNEGGDAAWRIKVTPNSESYFAEWVEFPSITLPALEKNSVDGKGGRILFPYNEGVLISDIDAKDSSWLCHREPEYPSMGNYYVFPNMVCSQLLGYIFDDAGLYVAAEDTHRSVKDLDFIKTDKGVRLRFRLYCGVDFGESFAPDYPIVFSRTEGRWEAIAERYRRWFESALPPRAQRIRENRELPEWYEDSPLVISYPVRGIHDMDEMKPNALYPYTNALPLLEDIKRACDCRLMVLLMHWEGTAPWAPPYVWPPFGELENFELFLNELHQKGDMLGVYCSGFGYTSQSNLIASYNKMDEYEKDELWRGMCADLDGKVAISNICTGQRQGFDICPASKVGRELLDKAYGELLAQNIDYVQILDQNHGGGQYFCYSREHGHPPAPGAWMTENMQNMLADWNGIAQKTLLGCESAAAEPFIGNLLYSDNRFELNYAMGEAVPLYAYIYHEYVRNFMGNQVGCPLDTKTDTLRYRLAYSFCAGDSMTLVLTPDGDLMTHWGTRDFEHAPNKEKAFALIRNLMSFYKNEAKKFLFAGRMITPPDVECGTLSIDGFDSYPVVKVSALLYSAWESEDGDRALILVNPSDREEICSVGGRSICIPALSARLVNI